MKTIKVEFKNKECLQGELRGKVLSIVNNDELKTSDISSGPEGIVFLNVEDQLVDETIGLLNRNSKIMSASLQQMDLSVVISNLG